MQFSKNKILGQRSNITLLITVLWAAIGIFILIVGHLSIVFFIYSQIQGMDTLAKLAQVIPMLEKTHLYILAGLAMILDVWILISHKKQREYKIKR